MTNFKNTQSTNQASGNGGAPNASAESYQDRLSRILAKAGATAKTPQPSKQSAAAQPPAANSAQTAVNIVSQYGAALKTDPTKVLNLELEFASAAGASEEIYLKCYPDAAGHAVWDMFGIDISYVVPDPIANGYTLYDDYYRGIPDQLLMSELSAAKITSSRIL